MNELVYTLHSDGSSDRRLMPILDWLLRANSVECAIHGQWADLRFVRLPPREPAERIRKAASLYPCELLFVHRDAEREPYAARHAEIMATLRRTTFDGNPPAAVCVIPVRMQEAWLLFDEPAIRHAAGNPAGVMPLKLPALKQCERLPDPKSTLYGLLREASGKSGRRREKLDVHYLAHRVPEWIEDFGPLRALPAFAQLEDAWDRR